MDMSMGSSSMSAATPTITSAMSGMAMSSAASATASAAAMDMGGSMGSCKISMLWNWYTVDSCFVASSWRITSQGMFAGSCIGVILLVMALEALRRGSQEYDAYILRSYIARAALLADRPNEGETDLNLGNGKNGARVTASSSSTSSSPIPLRRSSPRAFRPSAPQQAVRAVLHMFQFGVAYFVMLLAMYFNGYIIISILIGALLGAFVFSWKSVPISGKGENDEREVTFCCG